MTDTELNIRNNTMWEKTEGFATNSTQKVNTQSAETVKQEDALQTLITEERNRKMREK